MDLRRRIAAHVTDIRDRGQRLVQLNLELLAGELKEKGRKFGAAVGLFAAAGLFSLYALGFLLATVVALLALVLPLWASLLIVTAALFALVAILVLVGRDQFRKIGDPKPQAAIAEAEQTAAMVKANARGIAAGVGGRLRPRRPAPPAAAGQPPAPVAQPPAAVGSPPDAAAQPPAADAQPPAADRPPPAAWSTAPPPPPSGPPRGTEPPTDPGEDA